MALINTQRQDSSYTTLVQGFEDHRHLFKSEWERLIEFMQRCYGYVQDYISLCEYALCRPAAECQAFFADVLLLAKAVSEEAQQVESKHEKVYKELRKRRNKFAFALASARKTDSRPLIAKGMST